ncbi:MAG TPA: flagellar biosynthetic protein FliR [Terriglobales bacterium]|nr:flagellar biosynthetic protein FliR [Terriglobales bacterium]
MPAHSLNELVSAFMFGMLRIGGVMVFAPFFGSQGIPMQVKAGFTLSLSLLLYPAYAPARWNLSPAGWTRIAFSEAAVGLLLGLTLSFVLEAAQFAGQVTGLQMGFSLVSELDPQTQADTPVISIFHQLVVLLIFLQLNVHHWLLRGLAASFAYLPPGQAWTRTVSFPDLLQAAGGIWLAGMQIAAPVLVATVLTDIGLGFLGKASPQTPVLLLGLSLKAALGMVILICSLRFWPSLFERYFSSAVRLGEQLLQLQGS